MKKKKQENDKEFEMMKTVFGGDKNSEHSTIEKRIFIAMVFASVFLIVLFIDRIICKDDTWTDIIIDVIGIYLLLFVIFVAVNCLIGKSWKLKKYIIKVFEPVLHFFAFMKKCDFIFIKEFFIEIGITFIFCVIISYVIAINGAYTIMNFMGGQGSIYYIYLFGFGFILICWSLLKKFLHYYIFEVRKKTYGGDEVLKEMYFKQMCHQLKEIFYFFSIILMLNDYIKTDIQSYSSNNITIWHVLNVCLIILFAFDTLRANWKVKMELD